MISKLGDSGRQAFTLRSEMVCQEGEYKDKGNHRLPK